jgi:ABC-type uncharacterized transport system fused permease/ATPase subunit
VRLIGVSVLQSAASSILAPSLRHVADALALTWRRRLTRATLGAYLKPNIFYSVTQARRAPTQRVWRQTQYETAKCAGALGGG